MPTLSSVPEDLEKFKNSPSIKTLESLGKLLKLAEPYMKNGVHEDWQEFIAAVQRIPHEVDRAVNQQIKSVLDELEGIDVSETCVPECSDEQHAYHRGTYDAQEKLESTIQKIRSRYE